MYHSPFDQPSYKKAKKARKKAPVRKKAPARKRKAKPERPTDWWRLDATAGDEAVAGFAKHMTRSSLSGWLLDTGTRPRAGTKKGVLVDMVVSVRREQGGGEQPHYPSSTTPQGRAETKVTHARSGGITQAQFDQIITLSGGLNTWVLTGIIEGLVGKPLTPWHLTKSQAAKVIKHLKAKPKRPKKTGHPHANIASGQHWSFVYSGQFGYLITHGKVVSKHGERCHVKPAKGALSTWIPDSRGEGKPSLEGAGTMVECHSPGDLVCSRLIEPYKSKAQFRSLAETLRKAYAGLLKSVSRNPLPEHESPEPGCYCYMCERARKRRGPSREGEWVRRSVDSGDGLGPAGFTEGKIWHRQKGGPSSNPAAKERQHVKDKPYEAFRKTVSPVLKKVDKLLTKRSLDLVQHAADEQLEAALEAWGPANTGSVQSLKLYYVPLARNLQAELAETKRAAAVMRARATRQKDYNEATKAFTRSSWEITENILRLSDLMKWEGKRLHNKALGLFYELTEVLRHGRLLASNPHPERWGTNPQGFLFPARRI